MARITVEDCLDHVDNRFQLIMVATKRARQLAMGQDSHVPWENDKPTVVALREIAEGYVGPRILDEEEVPVAVPELMLEEVEADSEVEAKAGAKTAAAADEADEEDAGEAPQAPKEP